MSGSVLNLPPVEARIRHPIGEIRHLVNGGGPSAVTSRDQVRVSKRRTGDMCTLANGQRVLVSTTATVTRPAEAAGLLHESNGDLRWLWHRSVEDILAADKSSALPALRQEIADEWQARFFFRSEVRDCAGETATPGLRPPQLGALHAVGAHWSLQSVPGTIVMPTGTGKTETMLSVLPAFRPRAVLVIVPSKPLREQTVRKFLQFGLLRELGVLARECRNPIVGVIHKRPTEVGHLDIFEKCNVVVTTIHCVAQGEAKALIPEIAKCVDVLLIDEAHHIAADTWTEFRAGFPGARVLQFTATPFRRDGKLVDGKVIFSYPLRDAQRDGYFKAIAFKPIYALDSDQADRAIAEAATAALRSDLSRGLDHLLLARCGSIARAEAVRAEYLRLAQDLAPEVIHSEQRDVEHRLQQLVDRKSRIAVCVDMLGEGFDLPNLKVAALHDPHKSLAVILQFTGRFTRSAGIGIGDATVIANIGDVQVAAALERLYSEDADWNALLSEFSSDAVRAHAELVEFLNESARLDGAAPRADVEVSHHLLRPKFSTLVFHGEAFAPKAFHRGVGPGTQVHRVWLHAKSNTLYFVTRCNPVVEWTQARDLRDHIWDLFVLSYDANRKLLYLHATDKSSTHDALAKAVCGDSASLVRGDVVFRALGRINRLMFQNIGVKKHGRRNLRYAMYTGADVKEALSIAEKAGSEKANLFGGGWQNGAPVTIGAAYKGRIWTRDSGTIPEWMAWAKSVGDKLMDTAIDTGKIIENVLIPTEVSQLPPAQILSIEWPLELLHQVEDRVKMESATGVETLGDTSIGAPRRVSDVAIQFDVTCARSVSSYELTLDAVDGYRVGHLSGPALVIVVGRLRMPLEDYLSQYPPLMRFVDLSELDGNLLVAAANHVEPTIADERFEVWGWAEVDAGVESMWRDGQYRARSIQEAAAKHYSEGGFEIVFNDDDPGEAADLVCMLEEDARIRLALVHCKFAHGGIGRQQVADVVEVAAQAVRSAQWKWRFKELCKHLAKRDRKVQGNPRGSRFIRGGVRDLERMARASRFKPVAAEIVIVQPGLSQAGRSQAQTAVLAAAASYLKETVGVDLDVICSA